MCLSDSDSSSGVTRTQRGMKSKISVGMLKLISYYMRLSDSDSSRLAVLHTQRGMKLKPPVGMLKLLTKISLLVNTCRFRPKTIQDHVNKRRYITMKLSSNNHVY